jgi:hypothetical protein
MKGLNLKLTLNTFLLSCIACSFSFSEVNLYANTIEKIRLNSETEDKRRRRTPNYEDVSKYELSEIKKLVHKYKKQEKRTKFDLISSTENKFIYKMNIEIKKVSGNVEFQPVGTHRRKLQKTDSLNLWDKIFTADKSSLSLKINNFTKIEISKNSSLMFKKFSPKDNYLEIFLVNGKMRLIVEQGFVNVETLNASVTIPKGKIDIMISGMNTLIAPREHEVKVHSKDGDRIAKVGSYTLVTSKGSMITSSGKSDQKKGDSQHVFRSRGKKYFLKSK